MAAANKVSLKLVIDTERRRVLYAEADNEFVDFLFKIMTLPIRTFIPLLNQEMVGGLGNIYESIQNISTKYLRRPDMKDNLLTPKVYLSGGTGRLLQLPNVSTWKLYGCSSLYCSFVSDDCHDKCFFCKDSSLSELRYRNDCYFTSETEEGGYVEDVVTYMVTDDLAVEPLSSTASITTLLDKLNVKEIGTLEEKMVDLGTEEGMKLLRASLLSKRVLTDVFLPILKEEENFQENAEAK